MEEKKNDPAKIVLLVLTICAVIAVVFGTLFHIIGWGFRLGKNLGSDGKGLGDMIEKEETLDSFKNINVDADLINLTIETGDGYSYKYRGPEKLFPRISVDGDKLLIKQRDKKIKNLKDAKVNEDLKLILTVPEGAKFKTGDVTVDLGNLDMKDISFDKLSIVADLGNVEGNNIRADKLNINADLGNVEIHDLTFTDLEVDADLGNVEIESAEDVSGYEISVETDMGSVTVFGEDVKHEYQRDGSGGSIDIDADMGNVEIR